jgi:RNA polymerase sigma factor for flagellar operon FliA
MSTAQHPRAEGESAVGLTRDEHDRFLPLIRRTAMRLARRVPRTVNVADLVGYGWMGLLEAKKRAPSMPTSEFEAYALYRVRGAMLDYLRTLDPATRAARGTSRRVARAIRDLTGELQRAPEEGEIAERLGITAEAYQKTLAELARTGMNRLELVDVDRHDVVSHEAPPDEAASKRELVESLSDAITHLPVKLQHVLALYYQESCTLREIGAVLGVSESRISQLHTEAIHRLRAAIGQE